MEVRQSVLGEIAIRSGQHLTSVDLGALIRQLVLFDRVIVKSFRLRELRLLVRTFGKKGIQELLSSGALKFCCEFTGLVADFKLNGVRTLPADHFTFGIADAAHRDDDLRKELRALQSVPDLKNNERDAIEEALWNSLIRPPNTFGTDILGQLDSDLRTNSPSLQAAILNQMHEQNIGSGDAGDHPLVSVEETQERVFHIKTNILQDFGLSPEETHLLLQRSVTAVANLNQRLAEMEAYASLTGFLESEAPLLFGKIAGIIAPQNPKIAEDQFQRVIGIADIPDFKPGQRVDVEKLMEIRESAECRDFRGWLSTAKNISDAAIHDMAAGMKNKVATLAGGTGGRVLRFAATTLVGLIPGAGLVLGPAASAIDSFLVERVLPRSGILAFLTDMYPSLFVSP
ncbi:MAG: hypothetical protein ACLQMO_10095 [Acidobacteriaceae bacterium]